MSVSRETILKAIADHLSGAYSPLDKGRSNTVSASATLGRLYRAEALICLLEIDDCGSVGGFDVSEDGHGTRQGLYSLEERYEALKKKGTPRK